MSRVADSTYSEVHMGQQSAPERIELDPDRPFQILIAGDFSGRAWDDDPPRSLAPRLVDRDNFDEVMLALNPSIDLHGIRLSFSELEDFHPDRIRQATPIFDNLDAHLAPPPTESAARTGSLLDDMVDQQDPAPGKPVTLNDALDLAGFIQRVSRGYVEPKPGEETRQRQAASEALASDLMRGILHHPRMQAIEAAWRALFLLIRGLDTDGELKVYILDITMPELVANLAAAQNELRKRGPWALLVGNYVFGQGEIDAQALERLAVLAQSLGAPFLAEARLPGESASSEAWTKLRKSSLARWIGLALPRFLLRLPYGKSTSAIESFPFEEMPESEHNAYLWGNPAFVCAYLLGKTFLSAGWQMNRVERRIGGLPQHIYREDGEPVAKPCAEVLMTEKEASSLLDEGIMPLASIKREPAALLVRFQSIAQPAASLAGLK